MSSSSSSSSWVQRTPYVSFKWSCLLLMLYSRSFSKTVSTERESEGCALSSYKRSIFKPRATENIWLHTYVHAFNFIMNPPTPSSLTSTVSKVDCWTRMISRSVLRVRVCVCVYYIHNRRLRMLWSFLKREWETLAAVLIKTRESSTTTRPSTTIAKWDEFCR